ncbi:MAG TPA: hypothetical protein VLF60_02435 [Candidatus Saccharimonadales bacterium]|nr:hypothetical protein [Candidatus Saccharimonadales bacterium]
MKKDIIYIDVEDDLTAIIEKIKKSGASIIALVPPRRLGVLQSVVNLKLLKRAADEVDKKAVLITSDQSLMSLTAGIGLPIARNLQSRPEIVPENPEESAEPDIIEGQAMTDATPEEPQDDNVIAPSAGPAAASPRAVKPKKPKSTKKFKVPNFESFRKRILLIGGGLVLLIGFLVWAVMYAPKATVVVKAQTQKVHGKIDATVDSDASKTDANAKAFKGQLRQDTKNLTQTFTPTGKKDVGDKAGGNITIRNCDYSDGFTLQAGAQFVAASGQTFVSTQSVTVPKFSGSASTCTTNGSTAGSATVAVQASAIGDSYNVVAQNYSLPGITGKVDAVGTAMTGGSKKTVTVVTQDDVDKAKQLALAQDPNIEKQALIKQFDKSAWVLDDTFVAKQGTTAVSPNVDQEATGQATLTIPMTYTVLGIANSDINSMLSAYFNGQIENKAQQKVYDNGYSKLSLTITDKPTPQKATISLDTNGYLGPNIDTAALATQLVGKRYGEIESIVKPISGVQSVDSKFSPFWVTKAPKATKITIKLEVANAQ